MTPIKNQKGFTIIEVLLFLAISGLFFLIALIGVGGRSQNAQFTDSIRATQGFLEKEMASVTTGVNPSGNTFAGTDENRILLGKMFQATDGTDFIKGYVVSGLRKDTLGRESEPVDDLIMEADPEVDPTSEISYQIRWGLTLKKSLSRGGNGGRTVEYFGFLLNPATNRMSIIVIESGVAGLTGNPLTDLNEASNYNAQPDPPLGTRVFYDQELSLHLCYENSNGRIGEVVSGEAQLGMHFTSKFDSNVEPQCL